MLSDGCVSCSPVLQLAGRFVHIVQSAGLSVAEMQGYLMFYKSRPQAATDNVVRELVQPKVRMLVSLLC